MATVLIVDDEPQARETRRAWLRKGGYETVEAADEEAALRLLASSPQVEAVLCDVRMPGGTGMWLVDRIRASYPTLGVVFVTSQHDLPAYSTLPDGVVGYLLKPFGQSSMLALVDEAVHWGRDAAAFASESDASYSLDDSLDVL